MTIDDFIQINAVKFDSEYEIRFARTVLADVDGLDLAEVDCQVSFIDSNRVARRVDFLIDIAGDLKLAIEVDGYDKTGTGSGMSREDFDDFLDRQNSIPWPVLRFSNSRFTRDPGGCVRVVAAKLREVRGAAKEPGVKSAIIRAKRSPSDSNQTAILKELLVSAFVEANEHIEAGRRRPSLVLRLLPFVLALAIVGIGFYWLNRDTTSEVATIGSEFSTAQSGGEQ